MTASPRPRCHPDGHTLAVGDFNGSVAFLDARTRRRIGELAPDRADRCDRVARVQPRRQPPRDRRGRARRAASSNWPKGEPSAPSRAWIPAIPLWETVLGVQFSPDSRVLAAQTAEDGFSVHPAAPLGRADGSADRRHPPDPRPGIEHARVPRRPAIGDVERAGPRHRRPRRRDLASRRAGSASPAPVAAMSRSARMVAFGSRAGSVRLLDLRSGALRTAAGRHDGGDRDADSAPTDGGS